MRKNRIIAVSLAAMMSLSSVFSSFAEWKQDEKGWWWTTGYVDYATSTWQLINDKEYYFGADGYMLHDTIQDGIWLGSDGAAVIPDIGLEVAPYKADLDAIIANNQELYNVGSLLFDGLERMIDCGDYYVIKDVELYYQDFYSEYNSLYNAIIVGKLDELRIRKDGLYLYNFNSKVYTKQQIEEMERTGILDDYITLDSFGWMSNVKFDNKGYVIGYCCSYAS